MSNVPLVPQFVAGTGYQQSDMTTMWTDPASFFFSKVVFRAQQTTTATTLAADGAPVKIAYDDVLEDPFSGWSSANHWWTCPSGYSGWYQVTVAVWVAGPAAEEITLTAYVSSALIGDIAVGSVVIPEASSGVSGSWYVYLVGGSDAIHGSGSIANSSATLDTSLTAGENSTLEITWIST